MPERFVRRSELRDAYDDARYRLVLHLDRGEPAPASTTVSEAVAAALNLPGGKVEAVEEWPTGG